MQLVLSDILLLLIVYSYVVLIIKLGEFLKKRGYHPSVTRKLIHLFAGDSIVAIGWFSSVIWPILVPGGLLILLLVLLLYKKEQPMIGSMFYSEKGGWHNYGPLYYIASILILLIPLWERKDVIVASTFVMAWGDGMAALLSERIRVRHAYPWSDRSLEGSLAFLTFGLLGTLFGLSILNLSPSVSLSFSDIMFQATIASIVGSIAEILTMGALRAFDNFTVPFTVATVLYFVIRKKGLFRT